MKKSYIAALLLTLPFSAPFAWANDAHHPEKDKKSSAMTENDKSMQMSKMQENMLRMHEQMHKIMDAKTPEEREQLTQENMKMMQENMQMMHGMSCDSKGGKMGGKMGGSMKGMKGM